MPVTPLLRCRNLDETREFYCSVLGFQVSAAGVQPLTVEKQGGRLLFTEQDLWAQPTACSATFYFTVADVDADFAAIKAKAPLRWPLQDMPYGSREFGISDCNGYTLAFQQQA